MKNMPGKSPQVLMLRHVVFPTFIIDLEEKVTICISKVINELELYQAVRGRDRGGDSGEVL